MSDEVFQLKETTIGKLVIEEDDVQFNSFVIPLYQRRYDWKKDQWNMLLVDIERYIESNDSRDLFLGTIITLSDEKHNPSSIEMIHDVIDGQQRLTTIFILYISIIEQLKLLSLDNLGDAQKRRKLTNTIESLESICSPKRLRHDNDTLLPGGNETMYQRLYHTVFRLPIGSPVDRRSRYFLAYKFYSDALKKKIAKVVTDDDKFDILFKIVFVVKRARIIWASVKELSFAIQMFDVLNSRGLPLSVTDIIRTAYLASMLDSINSAVTVSRDDVVNHVNALWIELKRNIVVRSDVPPNDDKTDALFRRFLRHIYMLHKGSPIIENRMPDEYKKWMRSVITAINYSTIDWKSNSMEIILKQNACLYGFIHNPRRDLPVFNMFQYLEELIRKSKASSSNHERVVTEMLYDITNLGLIQVNLLLLIVLSEFANGNFSNTEYNNRFGLFKTVICQIWKFVIRRNITDEPRPNDMDGISLRIINYLHEDNNRLLGSMEKLRYISVELQKLIDLSYDVLEIKCREELRYDSGQNTDLRYILHILEKWENRAGEFLLRNSGSPFDGFEMVAAQGSQPRLKWTIEHVLPQSLLKAEVNYDEAPSSQDGERSSKSWIDDLDVWNSKMLTMSENDKSRYIHSIGNLTLMDHNSNLSDSQLHIKQQSTRNGNLIGFRAEMPKVLNHIITFSDDFGREYSLSTVNKWTEMEIDRRENSIIKRIIELLQ
jgi:hypothetical protein